MNAKDRTVQIVAGLVVLLGLAGSSLLSSSLAAEAGRAQLVYTDEATEADPPEVALGIAMGAFRGLFVNYLWLRATRLKEEGKYHEAIELSNAITRLQPRFPRVWAFHAWNMAYNISVATNTAEERWQWVEAGIDLLRDDGIPKNPNELLLYKELAWIFAHKVQGFQDDANRYYKKELAREWTVVLGTPPELPMDRAGAVEAMQAFLGPIVGSPETLEGVIERELEDRNAERYEDEQLTRADSTVAELVRRIRSETEVPLGEELLRLAAISFKIKDAMARAEEAGLGEIAPDLRRQIRGRVAQDNPLNQTIDELVNDPAYEDAWERLLPHVRKRVIVDEYKMSPARMQEYMSVYGPLDYRHPAAHAVYWSALGVERTNTRQGTTTFATLNTDRITVQAIQELFRSGSVTYDILTDSHYTMYSTHYADIYGELLKTFEERGGRSQDRSERIYTTYSQGYLNFVADVARVFYRMGDTERAQEYFEEFRSSEYITLNDYIDSVLASGSLEDFVNALIRDDDRLTIPHVAASETEGAIRMALTLGLVKGNERAFVSNMKYARSVHAYYFENQDTRTLVDANTNRMEEMPPEFALAVGQVFMQILTSSGLTDVDASIVYGRASTDLKALVWDSLANFYGLRGYPENVFRGLFPEPANMETFRQERAQMFERAEERQKRRIEFERQ